MIFKSHGNSGTPACPGVSVVPELHATVVISAVPISTMNAGPPRFSNESADGKAALVADD